MALCVHQLVGKRKQSERRAIASFGLCAASAGSGVSDEQRVQSFVASIRGTRPVHALRDASMNGFGDNVGGLSPLEATSGAEWEKMHPKSTTILIVGTNPPSAVDRASTEGADRIGPSTAHGRAERSKRPVCVRWSMHADHLAAPSYHLRASWQMADERSCALRQSYTYEAEIAPHKRERNPSCSLFAFWTKFDSASELPDEYQARGK